MGVGVGSQKEESTRNCCVNTGSDPSNLLLPVGNRWMQRSCSQESWFFSRLWVMQQSRNIFEAAGGDQSSLSTRHITHKFPFMKLYLLEYH